MIQATKRIIIIILVMAFIFSCKKNTDKTAATIKIEYRISPMNPYFTEITYTDISGPVTITDPAQFVNGSKVIYVSKKPFLASFQTKVNNTNNYSLKYLIAILVNDSINKVLQSQAPPGGITSQTISTTVE